MKEIWGGCQSWNFVVSTLHFNCIKFELLTHIYILHYKAELSLSPSFSWRTLCELHTHIHIWHYKAGHILSPSFLVDFVFQQMLMCTTMYLILQYWTLKQIGGTTNWWKYSTRNNNNQYPPPCLCLGWRE